MPLATHSWLHSLLTASDDHEAASDLLMRKRRIQVLILVELLFQ